MSSLYGGHGITYDVGPTPILHLSLRPDVSLTEDEKRCFEQNKKILLSDPYFCTWSEKQIAEYLLGRLDTLARYFQFWYRSSRITFSKEIWGSCSWDDDILINFNIALAPFRLREYLFVHELVHTQIKDHGDEFWRLLDVCAHGKAKALDNELQRYGMRLAI
ncbi:MAG: M48 family metallopeptidase [Anaerohalosphaeraceae bacterium]